MTDDEFDAFLDKVVTETQNKNLYLNQTYKIGALSRFDYDITTGKMTFSDKVGLLKKRIKPVTETDIILVGSHIRDHESYQWAWASEKLPEATISQALKLKQLAKTTQLSVFEKPKFECNDDMAFQILCMACDLFDGAGIYKAPGNNIEMHFVLKNVRHLK